MNKLLATKTIIFFVFYVFVVSILSSCKLMPFSNNNLVSNRPPDDGMVHGTYTQSHSPLTPLGMVYVPPGVNIMGQPDENSKIHSLTMKQRNVTIEGFWMDATETTNNQYRQYVTWVLDSITAKLLGFIVADAEGNEAVDWVKYYEYGNSKTPISNEELVGKLSPITIPKQNLPLNLAKKLYVINVDKIIYHYEDYDLREVSSPANRKKSLKQMIRKYDVKVYPDTFVWLRDFSYSYNEPMARKYYSDPSFGNYPVVGVNWKQAVAFCNWRTNLMNSYLSRQSRLERKDYFRLPSDYEWEYAAKGGRIKTVYPWGNYYLRNKKGCLLANFKPRRGDYAEDGAITTAKADAYWPNDFGLYNMSGNVSEWTNSIYYEGSSVLMNDLNPNVEYTAKKSDPLAMTRKIIKGGSWKDIGNLLQLGSKSYEYQDTVKSYLGFRTVISLPLVNL